MTDATAARTTALRIATVEIPVGDLRRAIGWYHEALGLECTWSDDHHATLAGEVSAAGAPGILLVQTEDPARLGFRSSHTSLRHAVIDFRLDDLEALHALHARLRALGPSVDELGRPGNDWAPTGFGFEDPDGNRLGAFAYGRGQPGA